MVDLHVHSTASDGDFPPEELVDRAQAMGLSALAVSDHDTLEGSARAMRRGAEVGMRVVSAVEVSASLRGKVVHVLGYCVDLGSESLERGLREVREYRTRRAEAMVGSVNAELRAAGKEPMDLGVLLRTGAEKPIGRPDIAQYLVDLGHVKSRNEAFDRWLNKYNEPNRDLSAAEAIALIHAAGGAAVIAHPHGEFMSLKLIAPKQADRAALIAELVAQGLDGIEAYRERHTPAVREEYLEVAREHDLVATGGSDYHGPRFLHSAREIGTVPVPDETVDALVARSARWKGTPAA